MDKPSAIDPSLLMLNCCNNEGHISLINVPLKLFSYELLLSMFEQMGFILAVDEEGTIYSKTPGGWTITIFIPR